MNTNTIHAVVCKFKSNILFADTFIEDDFSLQLTLHDASHVCFHD